MARQAQAVRDTISSSQRTHRRLNPSGPVPLYHQIFLIIRNKIYAGDLLAGDRVPGEQDLTEEFGVSRITAKRALNELADAGLVIRERGRGTRVIKRPPSPAVTSSIEGWLENISLMGVSTKAEVLEFDYVAALEDIAAALEVPTGAEVQRAMRVRRLEGQPMSFLVTYVPADIGRSFGRADLNTTPLLQLLEKAGVDVASARQTISATIADAEVANALESPAGAPLIEVRRVVRDRNERPVEYIRVLYRPDLYRFEMSMRRNTGDGDAHWTTTNTATMTDRPDD
ncbi:MAG: GntR family transcriptional regulator [Hyphomicrobiales bacterium]|nr:GntR family transcriptional regulator [Hyphomicrobiales bacterium]